MGFPIAAGDRVHFVGDSLTAFGWFSPTGGFVDQVNATWPVQPMAPNPGRATGSVGVVVSGAVGAVALTQPTIRQIIVTSSGIGGNKAADIASDVTNRIVAFNPTKVVLEVGVNDVLGGTDPTAFAASLQSIVTQTQTTLPSVQFLFVGILCYGEQWLTGPAWGANSADTGIATITAKIQSVAAANSQYYADLRTPLLAYEAANNLPGPPGATFGIVVDSSLVHPIIPGGQVLMGTWVFQNVTVTP